MLRILIQVFGYSLELSRDESHPIAPFTAPFREVHHSAQTDFGFVKQLDYPDERWTDS